jgi:hypothetical protein
MLASLKTLTTVQICSKFLVRLHSISLVNFFLQIHGRLTEQILESQAVIGKAEQAS